MVNLPKGIHVTGEGPAVILLHSSLSSSKQWLTLVKHLKADFKVINIDILGYGTADGVEDIENYSANVEVSRIKNAIKQLLAKDEPYHIVGHSCGGALGLKLAIENPSLVLSLSLYEPVAFHLLEDNSEAKAVVTDLAHRLDIHNLPDAAATFMDYWNEKGAYKRLPNPIQEALAQEMKKVQLDFLGLMAETYGGNEINKITAPVLFMIGNESPFVSKVLANIIVKNLNNVKEMSFDAGHMGVITKAKLIQPIIDTFIRENNPTL